MFKYHKKIAEDNFIFELRKKNEDAMLYVIERYGRLFKSIICKYLKNGANIEECLDDVFMDIWNNIDKFDINRSTFANWGCAIARYNSIDILRKIKIENDNVDKYEDSSFRESATYDLYSFDNELDESIDKAFNMLSIEDREILKAIYLEDKSSKYIADSLGIDMSNMYNRLSRARKKFKVFLWRKK